MSAFQKAGHIYQAGGRTSLKIVIGKEIYFVASSDLSRALKNPNFTAPIVRLAKHEETSEIPATDRPSFNRSTNTTKISFSLNLSGEP